MGIRILESGFNVTIQDLGRPRFQHLGVPVSGAVAPSSLRLANALVGNEKNVAGLEIRLLGPMFEVMCDSIRIALVGSFDPVEIIDETIVKHPPNQSILVKKGQKVRIGPLSSSGAAYLAVEGGFDLPKVYESLSTYIRASIGGFHGRAIENGDIVPLNFNYAPLRSELKIDPKLIPENSGPIRVILGPQNDYFTKVSIKTFFNETYTITQEADRMGARLDGPTLKHAKGYNIVSDGIATGAVQVPGTGQPIILLADHQTTGGYPKLGTVISTDIERVGKLRAGDEIYFLEVSIEEAESAAFGGIWRYLVVSGGIWRYLAVSAGI